MDDEFSGTIIAGRYRIVGTIGRGGMGRVYKAVDMRFGRLIALKVLEFLQETQCQNLAAEATILKQLSCPNIVQIYEYDKAGNSVYLATEYVEGRSMAQILAKGKPLDVRCAVEIAYQVGRGLDCVHRNGFVHRDVKPSNILISNYGRVLLADFGLATQFGAQLTEIGTVKGTPAYMSPEQVMGRSIDARSDIFSLGTVTYESITGLRPFQGKSAGDLVQNLVETDPAPPRGVNHLVDPGLEAVVLKALAKDPERRFSSMQLFLEALQPFRPQFAWADDGGSLLSKLLNAPADQQETAPAADITEFLSAPLRTAERFPLPTVPGSGSKGAEEVPAPEYSHVGALLRPAPRPLRRLWPIALACIILLGIAVAVMPLGKIGRSDRGSVWGYLALLAISLIVALLWFAYRFGVGRLHYDGLRSADAVSVNEPKHAAASHIDLLNRIVEEGSAGQSNSGEANLSALSQREFLDATTEIIPYTPSTELSKGEPSAMAWLLVLNGRLRGRQFRLTDTFTIGRSSNSDFPLFDDTAVSRQHARIALENGRFYIYDCGSKTGTMLNGAGVCKQELRDRDEIRIGHTNMLFINAVSPEDLTMETKRRLLDFDALWEELTRSVRHD